MRARLGFPTQHNTHLRQTSVLPLGMHLPVCLLATYLCQTEAGLHANLIEALLLLQDVR